MDELLAKKRKLRSPLAEWSLLLSIILVFQIAWNHRLNSYRIERKNRGAWAECLKYATNALTRDLPGPLFAQEALRMRGISAWHLGDDAIARAAFTELGKDAPPGRAAEAARWLDRLR